jgi:tetratricopeptide (TPR) repeat protein
MAEYGYALAQHGQLIEAQELLARCLDLCKQHGEDDPLTIVAKDKLFFVLLLNDDLTRAEPLGEQAHEGYRRILGDNHFITAWVLANRIRLYQMQGEWAKASSLVDQLLASDATQSLLGLEFRGRHLLADQKFLEAEGLLRQLMDVQNQDRSGSEEAFRAQRLVGASLIGQNRYAEAEPLLVQGYAGMRKWWEVRGKRLTPYRTRHQIEALQWLVQLYDGWGQPEEADKWRQELNAVRTRHPESHGGG